MKNVIIRLQEIEIKNLKNVEYGKIYFQSYNNLKKSIKSGEEVENNITDILGIYGQNGSGKTALINSIEILERLLTGRRLPKDILYLINNKNNLAELKFTLLLENKKNKENKEKMLIYYTVILMKNKTNIESDDKGQKVIIKSEELQYSNLLNNTTKTRIKKVINYDIDYENTFNPKNLYEKIIKKNKNNIISIGVSKTLAIEEGKSFIFNKRSLDIFKNTFEMDINYKIIDSLVYFAKANLFVINSEQSGIVNMNRLMPFSFRLEDNNSIISGGYMALFEKSFLSERESNILKKIVEQINIVINTIIPGLNIGVNEYGNQLDEEGNLKVELELVSIRDNVRIPLKFESDGIKKIISILSALIAMYNNESICLVVDELDAGIFEYLLGELLGILEDRAKGQLIFTSHNLRALEKLNKESILFTTVNPKNRYMKLTNVKNNNNLRDFYYRMISLGGQREELYNETNTFEMNYAFRKAGKVINELE